MFSALILREEIICLAVLAFLAIVSRGYRLGKDGRAFHFLLTCAGVCSLASTLTFWTANHPVPYAVSYVLNIIGRLSVILFAEEIFFSSMGLFYPRKMPGMRKAALMPPILYLLSLPFLKMEIVIGRQTWYCTGSAMLAGRALSCALVLGALILVFSHWGKANRNVRLHVTPILMFLLAAEIMQLIRPELRLTGGALTIVTLGFFFTLENPRAVLERKSISDALSGVESRMDYTRDLAEYDQQFRENPERKFIFLFADINNLKSINGTYGHMKGDEYISRMAVNLVINLQSAKHVYRMGGDEFLAVYVDSDEQTVLREMKKARAVCSQDAEKLGFSPMLAMGYAVSGPQYKNLHDVLRVSDYMMFRNRTEQKGNIALDVTHGGTHLNLIGLTDQVFDAMCLASEHFYPYIENMETHVTRISPAMLETFGLDREFYPNFGEIWMEKVHPEDRAIYREDITAAMTGKKQYHYCKYRVTDRSGNYVQVSCRGGIYRGRNGEPDIFSGYIVNHGEPETRDALTGLENFDILYDRVGELIRKEEKAILIRLDLNNLTRVRMLYGVDAEQTLCKRLADIFLKAAGEAGTVYSGGLGEFGFVLPGAGEKAAAEMYRRLRSQCVSGVVAGEAVVPVSMCAGAVQLPEAGLQDKERVRSALLYALETSRYERHDELVFFRGQEGSFDEEEMKLLTAIHRDCLSERKYFELRYQPILDLESGRLTGAEALLRWKSPEYGEIPPGRFIGFLENDPAYSALGYDILRRAVRWAGGMRERLPEFRINVNITALQLYEEGFVDQVSRILEEECFPRQNLMLELTERCKEMEFGDLAARVQELRSRGFRVALDDMGTGFSTIHLLLHLEVDEVKLDHVFTREMYENPNNRLYAKVLCDAAAERRMDICFEGVEDWRMEEELRSFGKILVQGYYYDRPMTPEAFREKYTDAVKTETQE